MTRPNRVIRRLALLLLSLLCLFPLAACGMSKEDAALYEQVLALALEEVGSDDWVFTGQCCGWGSESVNEYNQYNFYIDKADYDTYKHYWLEDVPREQYAEGLNEDLRSCGDPVQHCINIYRLNYIGDVEYGGVMLKKDTNYYLVSVYDSAVYYRYIFAFQDSKNFATDSGYVLDEGNPSRRMFFHQEGRHWIREELEPISSPDSSGDAAPSV